MPRIRDGTVPRGRAPELICEVLSVRLSRILMLADIGMDRAGGHGAVDSPLSKVVDHAVALWRIDFKIPSSNGGLYCGVRRSIASAAPAR